MQALQREQLNQTIVAQSTPRGMGAIAIVRLSGTTAFAVGQGLGCTGLGQQPYKLTRVQLVGPAGEPLDDALAAAMPGPKSYTGEDLLELHLHGGPAVVAAVLDACLRLGARAANPGEFTLRAFVHGRLDLPQAEAVGALIHAQTEGGRARALAALSGGTSAAITHWLHGLEGVAAAWLAQLDFPDDTLEGVGATAQDRQLCRRAVDALERLLGQMVEADEAPAQVVLMGAVNTGKSTLTNALCGSERALVDAEAGTTRDAIEVPLRWGTVQLRLWDTAGQRDDAQGVEARGIALGIARAETAAVVVWLCDGTAPVWPSQALLGRGTPVLVWGARADRMDAEARRALAALAQQQGFELCGFVSGQTGEGLAQLQAAVLAHCAAAAAAATEDAHAAGPAPQEILGNLRHRQQLQAALTALGEVEEGMAQGAPMDLLLSDLQQAVRALGQIVGRDVDARVLDRIFSDFCIGK